MVSQTPDDPKKNHRQTTYHRALTAACPNVEILLGQFRKHPKHKPVHGCAKAPPCRVLVEIREEKGSDVNLATSLLHDAHRNVFDKAIVITGDSDLTRPVRIVRDDVGKSVWVFNPTSHVSRSLKQAASEYRHIDDAVFAKSQLPAAVRGRKRVYTKPSRWEQPNPRPSQVQCYSVVCPDCALQVCAYRPSGG